MTPTSPSKIKVEEIALIIMVVKDLQKTMESYWNILGIGPWNIWTFKAPFTSEMTYHGKPSPHSWKMAAAKVGPISIQLSQPLEGDSIFKDFLEEHGEGLYGLTFHVKDKKELANTFQTMEKEGFPCLTSSHFDTGIYAYFDTVKSLKAAWEASIGPEGGMPPPEAVWPE